MQLSDESFEKDDYSLSLDMGIDINKTFTNIDVNLIQLLSRQDHNKHDF